jgi:cytosine/uracil/thiamine/allantoin permease
MENKLNVTKAVLVYQAGIANIFAVDCFNMSDYGRNAKRLMQGAFCSCESFARGLAAAGVLVTSATCNMAGDISRQKWSEDVADAPFFNSMVPVYAGVAA